MALVNNMWLRGTKKRIGGTVYYQAMGQTRHRELAAEVSNPRTISQMTQRVKWANLVNLYRANQSWMKYAFETKKTNQSEYNKWMSLNVTNSRIYLPKDVAAMGGCVVDSYIVTQGSLPSIEWNQASDVLVSNIAVGADFDFGPSVTIGSFSSALIDNNPAIRSGDQISFIRMTQMVNQTTGAPYVIVRKYEVIMARASTALLGDYLPIELLRVASVDNARYISFNPSGKSGGFSVILSRTQSGKTFVSTQYIVVVDNEGLIANYSSQSALEAAIASYGSAEDAFLSSTSAGTADLQPTQLSLLGMVYSGDIAPSYTVQQNIGYYAGTVSTLVFNQPVELSSITLPVMVDTGGESFAGSVTQPYEDKSRIVITWPEEGMLNNQTSVNYISVHVDGLEYKYGFRVIYNPGGME